jgi:hypothetical protein
VHRPPPTQSKPAERAGPRSRDRGLHLNSVHLPAVLILPSHYRDDRLLSESSASTTKARVEHPYEGKPQQSMLSVIAAVIRLVHAREQFRWVTRQRDLFRRDARGKAKYRCRRSVDYDLHEPGDLSDVWSRRTNEQPPRLMSNHRRRASPRPRVSDRPVRGGQLQWIKRFETSARTNHQEDNQAGVGGVHRESQTWDAVSGTELVSMTGRVNWSMANESRSSVGTGGSVAGRRLVAQG